MDLQVVIGPEATRIVGFWAKSSNPRQSPNSCNMMMMMMMVMMMQFCGCYSKSAWPWEFWYDSILRSFKLSRINSSRKPRTLNSHPACLGRSHPLLGWSDTKDGKTMGGAYGEWMYRAPPGSSRTSGGTALPPATLVGQTYTMCIDFPLDRNTPNPAQSLPCRGRGRPCPGLDALEV